MDRSYKIPPHLLDDLCSRLILNVPDEYQSDKIRTFFQIELAHWFYIDFYVPEDPSLKPVGIKEFAQQVFAHCPFLLSETDDVATLHHDWRKYKLAVPTCGVILLDPTRRFVLLVQGFSKSWGFPKGKINEEESFHRAAIRELYEETGHDVTDVLDESDYLEHTVGDQICRLYIVPDVDLKTHFLPQTRNEIRKLQWFPLDYLPKHKKDSAYTPNLGCGPSSFFMVIPFVKPLRKWIAQHPVDGQPQKKTESQLNYARHSANQFEQILGLDTGRTASHKSPVGGKRPGKKRPLMTQHRADTVSPQYTILQKETKADSLKKLDNIKRNLNIQTDSKDAAATGQARLAALDMQENPIHLCKEWKNFKLDINAIMQVAMKRA